MLNRVLPVLDPKRFLIIPICKALSSSSSSVLHILTIASAVAPNP